MANLSHSLLSTLSTLLLTFTHIYVLADNFGRYHSYPELVSKFSDLNKRYPELSKVHVVGKSFEQRDLIVLQISNRVNFTEFEKPFVKLIAGVHGNDAVGRELLIHLAEYLLSKYNEGDIRVRKIVDSVNIFILPSMNPDGFEHAKVGDCRGEDGKFNARGVDLSRGFTGKVEGGSNEVVPEVEAMKNWIRSHPFVLSVSLHGGSVLAEYPFYESMHHQASGEYNPAPDDDVFRLLARTYARHHKTMSNGSHCNESFAEGITNGAVWRDMPGSMGDYNYLHSNCMEISVGVSCCRYPPEAELAPEWENNQESLLAFVEMAHLGIKGFITDSETGQGISSATVSVDSIDHKISSTSSGGYWRLLVPGIYTVRVKADGFEESIRENIKVPEGEGIQVNFTLKRSSVRNLPPPANIGATASETQTPGATMEGTKVDWSTERDFGITENTRGETYMDRQAIEEVLRDLGREKPGFSQFEELSAGENISIPMIHLSKDLGAPYKAGSIHQDNRPHVLLIGDLNGDSPVGSEVLVRLARHLVTGFSRNDPTVVDILSTVHVHIVPLFNVYGAVVATPGDCTGEKYSGRDFNELVRKTDVATSSLLNLLAQHKFDLIVALEGGGKFIVIPRNVPVSGVTSAASELTEDEDFLQEASRSLAGNIPDLYNRNACADAKYSGIIHGLQLGTEANRIADYVYDKYRTLMLIAHIECCKYPPSSELPGIWKFTLQPMLNILMKSRQGIQGDVKNEKGEVIPSYSLRLDDKSIQDMNSSFFMLTTPGQHKISIGAPGYSAYVKTVLVTANTPFVLNLILTKLEFENIKQGYHNHTQMTNLLRSVSETCHDIVKMVSLGKTKLGLDIWMMHFGHDVSNRMLPRVLFMGNVNAEEVTSREMLLRLVKHLCDGYKQNVYLLKVLNEMHIYIIPSVDVDGAMLLKPGTCDVDSKHSSNRLEFTNDEDHMDEESRFKVRAVKAVIDQSAAPVVVNVRSGDNVVAYFRPIDEVLAKAFVSGRGATNTSQFGCPGQKDLLQSSIVDYSKYHPEPKSLMSFAGLNKHRAAVELRLGCCRYPPDDELTTLWNENVNSFISLIGESNKGVFGVVVDADSKRLLANVRVQVEPVGYVQYTDEKGRYAFYLPNGTYIFKSSMERYTDKETKVRVLLGPNASEVVIEMTLHTWLFGLSPMLTITIFGVAILLLGIFIIVVIRLKKSGNMQFDEMGFRQLPNADYDDEEDSDDLETVVMDRNSFHMKKWKNHESSSIMEEYHDEPSSDDDGENSLFEKRLISRDR